MKKLIIVSLLLCATLNAKGLDFENPNGKPFMLNLSFETVKRLETGYLFKATLPVTSFLTFKNFGVRLARGSSSRRSDVLSFGSKYIPSTAVAKITRFGFNRNERSFIISSPEIIRNLDLS